MLSGFLDSKRVQKTQPLEAELVEIYRFCCPKKSLVRGEKPVILGESNVLKDLLLISLNLSFFSVFPKGREHG